MVLIFEAENEIKIGISKLSTKMLTKYRKNN